MQSSPPRGLHLLRAVADLVDGVDAVTPDDPDTAGPVPFRRHDELAAQVHDPSVVEFLIEAPRLMLVMREALLLVLKLHHGKAGRCLECDTESPCTTERHLLRELRLSSGRR